MTLTTERMTLRTASEDEMRALIADEPDDGMKLAYTEMLEGCLAHPAQWDWYAVWWMLLTADAPDGTPAGTALGDFCFKGIAPDGMVEIGYGIRPAFEGRGYTTEAVRAACAWAVCQPGVVRVEAETEPDNAASQRVLQKCGFIPTGTCGAEGPRFVCQSDIEIKER